jgi:hypothetical protein
VIQIENSTGEERRLFHFLVLARSARPYRLGNPLLDPQSSMPKVNLAIQGRTEDGWYRLGILKVAP